MRNNTFHSDDASAHGRRPYARIETMAVSSVRYVVEINYTSCRGSPSASSVVYVHRVMVGYAKLVVTLEENDTQTAKSWLGYNQPNNKRQLAVWPCATDRAIPPKTEKREFCVHGPFAWRPLYT